jgi:hypothetical protein
MPAICLSWLLLELLCVDESLDLETCKGIVHVCELGHRISVQDLAKAFQQD